MIDFEDGIENASEESILSFVNKQLSEVQEKMDTKISLDEIIKETIQV